LVLGAHVVVFLVLVAVVVFRLLARSGRRVLSIAARVTVVVVSAGGGA
jgi:hypothetical protein